MQSLNRNSRFSVYKSSRRGAPRRLILEEMEPRWLLSAASLTSPPALTANATTNAAADETTVGNSIDAFALDLYAQLESTTGGNLFVSPFSIATALAMTYAGARGETAQQLASVLHLGSDAASVESNFGELLNDLNSAGQSGGYLLSVANALWAQQGLDILPEFLNVIQSDFGGGLQQADFAHDAEDARQTINNWVAQQTNGKIQDLFPPGSLDMYTKLVLANAVYFKAAWSSPFDANQTADEPFTLATGDEVTASTMHQTGTFRYMQSDGFQVLELPYANGRLAMDILLPTQSGLSALGSNQLPADLNGWLAGLGFQDVAVSLPKFQMTTQFALNSTLQALGMTDAFSTSASDFTGIAAKPSLWISSVYHKAYISVDEGGTEAAAATGVGIVHVLCISADPRTPIVFNADHPFLFLIRDTQSGSVLFMGQVENPMQQSSDSSAPVITQQPRSQDPTTPTPVTQNPVAQDPVTSPVTKSPLGTPAPLMGPIYTSPAKTASLSLNEKVVDAFYQALLGRSAEPAALAYWSKSLDGGASPASVVNGIEASTEYPQAEVESLYEHYLGRAADQAGLEYFTAKLASGAPLEQIAAELAGSHEFIQEHGGSPDLINALFSAVLGRAADVAANAFFDHELAAGDTVAQIATQLLSSDEYQQRVAATLLTTYLQRPADPTGVGYFANALRAGVTEQQAIAEILSSEEFLARVGH